MPPGKDNLLSSYNYKLHCHLIIMRFNITQIWLSRENIMDAGFQ